MNSAEIETPRKAKYQAVSLAGYVAHAFRTDAGKNKNQSHYRPISRNDIKMKSN